MPAQHGQRPHAPHAEGRRPRRRPAGIRRSIACVVNGEAASCIADCSRLSRTVGINPYPKHLVAWMRNTAFARHCRRTDAPCPMWEGGMDQHGIEETEKLATFGRRKVAPRVCVADGKQHVRTFLSETLEELGFIACECGEASRMAAVLDAQLPDLVVLGLSAGAAEAGKMLETLAAKKFGGKVLLLGPPDSAELASVHELGEKLGVAMLPMLATPFGSDGLRGSIATLLPIEAPPTPPVDAAEAMRAGWLELWYQ